jgi:hypothetical protein
MRVVGVGGAAVGGTLVAVNVGTSTDAGVFVAAGVAGGLVGGGCVNPNVGSAIAVSVAVSGKAGVTEGVALASGGRLVGVGDGSPSATA